MIINDECSCGVKVIVRTGADSRARTRRDGKQVIYADELTYENKGSEYDIFRCRGCMKPIDETCKSAAHEGGK